MTDVSAFGLQPSQDLPLGLLGSVGPSPCPGWICCAGEGIGLSGGLLSRQGPYTGLALKK
ncbi:hypothetical protein Pyn_20669 [Prunus yedoensis var. nudiflora]|uniref:Uncharacterized protein n=1 Tax=Prunus yedoensis var. nudiflora TaxID=2094558 RepID=A0A314UXN1_PRUYE|nr:hypothetical protein Pyn_20669 [Prunus yedoensis var. nudiflora]